MFLLMTRRGKSGLIKEMSPVWDVNDWLVILKIVITPENLVEFMENVAN